MWWKSPDEALVSRVKLLVEAKLTYLNKLTQHELWASASKPTLTVTVRTVTFILILFTYYLWYYSETHWLNELFSDLSKLTLPVYCQCWVVYHTICRLTIAPLVLCLNTSTLTAVSLHLSRFDPDRVKIKRAFCRTGSRWRSEFTSSTLRFTPRDVSTLRCARWSGVSLARFAAAAGMRVKRRHWSGISLTFKRLYLLFQALQRISTVKDDMPYKLPKLFIHTYTHTTHTPTHTHNTHTHTLIKSTWPYHGNTTGRLC